jgi:hypothetical protein
MDESALGRSSGEMGRSDGVSRPDDRGTVRTPSDAAGDGDGYGVLRLSSLRMTVGLRTISSGIIGITGIEITGID